MKCVCHWTWWVHILCSRALVLLYNVFCFFWSLPNQHIHIPTWYIHSKSLYTLDESHPNLPNLFRICYLKCIGVSQYSSNGRYWGKDVLGMLDSNLLALLFPCETAIARLLWQQLIPSLYWKHMLSWEGDREVVKNSCRPTAIECRWAALVCQTAKSPCKWEQTS